MAIIESDLYSSLWAFAKVAKLSEAETETLAVDDKWKGELNRVSQTLSGGILELAERDATPLPRLADEVQTLARAVDEHLKMMGFAWI